ncbi:MAG: bestrophin family ion channel [Gemmataceae bacterium]
MSEQTRQGFWREAFALQGSIAPNMLPLVAVFGGIAALLCALAWQIEQIFEVRIGVDVTPHELAGAALGLLLVLRTNAGYDRWWEARKLWGGFVDRSRNFVISALAYGPASATWRDDLVRWAAAYPHVARHSLRGEGPGDEVLRLLGRERWERVAAAEHMPAYVALQLAHLLRQACELLGMNRFAFLQVDRERALLIDNYGGCERIRNTPLPRVYSIKIRQFLFLFLLTLPIALLHRLGSDWLVPLITMLVAYPLLSLDQIGVELENPFAVERLSHLPLVGIATTIEGNLLALREEVRPSDQVDGVNAS